MSSIALGAATSGMRVASTWMNSSANNVANINTPDFEASAPVVQEAAPGSRVAGFQGVGIPDLSREIPNLMLAGHMFKANVVSAQTATDSYKAILALKP